MMTQSGLARVAGEAVAAVDAVAAVWLGFPGVIRKIMRSAIFSKLGIPTRPV